MEVIKKSLKRASAKDETNTNPKIGQHFLQLIPPDIYVIGNWDDFDQLPVGTCGNVYVIGHSADFGWYSKG